MEDRKLGSNHNEYIFVCSPYKGDIDANVAFAKIACRFVLEQNYIPVCPHLFYTRFLQDNVEYERDLGMSIARKEMERCKELWVFRMPSKEISDGMHQEMAFAKATLKIPVRTVFAFYQLMKPIIGG